MQNGNHKLILQPHNLEAEQSILGSLLIDQDAIVELVPSLKPDDFFNESNAWVYKVIRDLNDKNTPADFVTVCNELKNRGQLEKIGGEKYLIDLVNNTPVAVNVEHYTRIVSQNALKRRLIETAGQITNLACAGDDDPQELLAKSESLLLKVMDDRVEDKVKFIGTLAEELYDHIERVKQLGGITGLPTGLTDLDRLLGGMQRSDMIILAGRPGMGKTSLAVQLAKNASKNHGKNSLVFSLEMSKEQLAQRIVAAECKIEASRLRSGDIKDNEWGAFFKAQEALSKWPLAIDDSPSLTPSQLRSKVIRHHARHGLDLVVVDYIQLMSGDGRYNGNKHQEISDISRACKQLARELNIPVIVLSQLNRQVESRADKRPMLSDLRESGAIEADADVVIFTYRDEYYNPDTDAPNVAELIVSKHRSGPTGVVSAFFRKQFTEFLDLATNVQNFEQVN